MKNPGFVFLEIVIAAALVSVVFLTLLGIGFSAVRVSTTLQNTAQANSLIKEEIEAVRSFRDGVPWATMAGYVDGNPYHAVVGAEGWTLVAGTETVGTFTRQVVLSQDAAFDPNVSSADVVKVTVIVTWLNNKSLSMATYLTNWQE